MFFLSKSSMLLPVVCFSDFYRPGGARQELSYGLFMQLHGLLETVHLPTTALLSLYEAMEAKSMASQPAEGDQTESDCTRSLTSSSSRATLQEVLVKEYNIHLSAPPPPTLPR